MKSKIHLVILSFISALLLSISWYWHLTICIFFAFVPLLFVEDRISSSGNSKGAAKLFPYAYLCFFTWNILVTWWVVYASVGGASMAFLANSLLMSAVFVVFSVIKNRLNKSWAIWLLIPIWIAWEHGHTLWDLTWTWLTIGNVFAFNTNWIQWYEFTGTSGGTLWVLATNIFIFQILKNNSKLKVFSKPILKIAALIIVPIVISYTILVSYTLKQANTTVKEDPKNVVVVQPNIDPYNAKFSMEYQSQFLKVMDLIRGKVTDETDFLVLPETFITDDLDESAISESEALYWFRDSLIRRFPNLKIVTGGNTYIVYENEKDNTATSRKDSRTGKNYDVFNSAVYLDKNVVEVYHKSKLVPGVEQMPFPALLKPLEGLAINMGGTMGSLGKQDKRSVFSDSAAHTSIAPVVCYESVYADYVTGYIRNGANFIFIITNDGWWQDTPGYIQHLNYARLRAIENRRQIARSANTGISCFIDEFGTISEATNWWEEAVIEKKMRPNNELTFFSRFGDLISYTSVFASMLLILWSLFLRFKK
ncbi:apolipoprotein N-acyltransferase [Sphingobacteriaceae bacterium]|nr:apolipoprotein N-acyltransferase [Sphingobacteriaceae bacterium]